MRSFAAMVTASILSTKPGSTDSSAASSSLVAGDGPTAITAEILSMKVSTLNTDIRGAVLTAVHGELMSKDALRRAVVISGLPSKPGLNDIALVDELVETKFGYRPLIARTRRRVVTGWLQPIAVTYDAVYLVEHATRQNQHNPLLGSCLDLLITILNIRLKHYCKFQHQSTPFHFILIYNYHPISHIPF